MVAAFDCTLMTSRRASAGACSSGKSCGVSMQPSCVRVVPKSEQMEAVSARSAGNLERRSARRSPLSSAVGQPEAQVVGAAVPVQYVLPASPPGTENETSPDTPALHRFELDALPQHQLLVSPVVGYPQVGCFAVGSTPTTAASTTSPPAIPSRNDS